MEGSKLKEVYFGDYCNRCTHLSKKEKEEPCCDCLAVAARIDSHKPVYFEAKSK